MYYNFEKRFAGLEKYEMKSCNVLDVIQEGSVIALFSHPNANEPFYLCKIVRFGIAENHLTDHLGHHIPKGAKFITCKYFENCSECRGFVQYRL